MSDGAVHDRLGRIKAEPQESVMVNFMYQLDWAKGCPDSWQYTISGYVCEGVSRRD